MNKLKYYFPIFIILFLTVFLRLFWINKIPTRLSHDEMSLGYNAFSILKTGKDEWGRKFPLMFEAFGDWKLPAYIYASVLPIAIFNLSAFSVKIPSLISGFLIVYLIYLITWQIYKNRHISFWSSFICAISPWAVQISHQAREAHLATAFFLIAIYFLLKSEKRWQIIISSLFFSLTFYTYISYRLLIPAFLIISYFLNWKNNQYKSKFKILVLFILIFSLPLLPSAFSRSGLARFQTTSILNNVGYEAQSLDMRNFCFLSSQQHHLISWLCGKIYHPYIILIYELAKNYLASLSPQYLFLLGSEQKYLSAPGFGVFLIIFTPFYLLGLYYLFTSKLKDNRLIISAYLIAPLASILTGELQFLRLANLYPFVTIILGLGVYQATQIISRFRYRNFLKGLFYLSLIFNFVYFYFNYFYIYSFKDDDVFYIFDPQIVTTYLANNEYKYQKIYIDNKFPEAYIALAFYHRFDPDYFQKSIIRNEMDNYGFSHPRQLGKYYFNDMLLSDLVCHAPNDTLLLTSDGVIQPTAITFKNFANVHVQSSAYDIGLYRNYLQTQNQTPDCLKP